MKKYLILIICFVIFPIVVSADEYCANETIDTYCTGSSCLTSLQQSYNTWNTTGNSGKACIKVIAMRNGNVKSYVTGKNPTIDYVCANGNVATVELKSSALADSETDVAECQNSTCYIPELWAVDCGETTSTSDVISNSNTTDASGDSDSISNNNNNSVDLDDKNVTTNSEGQITGTTDTTETGVETYFIVLISLMILSYSILLFVNKKNIFKSI